MTRRPLTLLVALAAVPAAAQAPYKLPPKEVTLLLDAPPPPEVVVSPAGDTVLLAEPEAYPPIALLAEPVLRLGGVRISPATGGRQRLLRRESGSPSRRGAPSTSRATAPPWPATARSSTASTSSP
jgi:hypothetical protein